MSLQVQDLITAALRLVGRLRPGQLPNVSESTAALFSLNEMIDSWATERLMTFMLVKKLHALTGGTQTYAIGPGVAPPGFNSPRPIRIEQANAVTGVVAVPMKLVNAQEWSEITEHSLTGVLPRKLYNDAAWPNSNLSVWPMPSSGSTSIELYTWEALISTSGGPGFVNLTDPLSVAPGYQKALRFGLALAFAAEYGMDVRPAVIQGAADSKQKVMAMVSSLLLEAPQQASLEQQNQKVRPDETQGQPLGLAA